MTAAKDEADCFVCRKHRDRGALMPGGPVAEDELIVVSHTVTPETLGRDGATAYLGHLFVEPKRHAPGLADLTDAEARSAGWWCTHVSRALRDIAGAEHVYSAVIGDGVPHLHIHLVPRFPGTPREYWWSREQWWTRLDEWPGARRGGVAEICDLARDLSDYIADSSPANPP
ncbi:MAG: HIT family protein [Streptosporangiaceae bacterium]